SPAVGITHMAYSQTKHPNFSQIALTAKLGMGYLLLPPYWDFGLTLIVNALPMFTSHSDKSSLRFFGINTRTGLALPWIKPPWKLTLSGGAGFSRTFASNASFGFSKLFYFEFYPHLKRSFANTGYVSTYFKYVPFDVAHVLKFTHGEIGVGGTWCFKQISPVAWGVSLDLSRLIITTTRSVIASTSTTLSLNSFF
ncbi:MAG: hypothetical protein AAB425_13685, partial [Bdellovibrionota bacterium]